MHHMFDTKCAGKHNSAARHRKYPMKKRISKHAVDASNDCKMARFLAEL